MGAKEILKEAWPLREGPAVFTTVDKNGLPNSVYVLGMKLLEDGRIAVMDNYFHKTRENIKNGSKGSFLFLARPRKPYQAKGSIEYLASGPVYEDLKASIPDKFPRVAAAVLKVEEIYSGAEKLL
ncbi:MAG TPA: pyridoxamine 5-phosphate oxidase [Elusimicrobia bacterium]|nr:MAG: pyridoxamine 5-phosphate oxidase [Elusimicrobia bacterium GWD2_63_28]HCC47418.1 pyridoxamine 5-phosphate oxidase [Elusimicrobiota bacterium]